jgi:ubiquinone/menaquinone biosynthesis C-methylase UbiE
MDNEKGLKYFYSSIAERYDLMNPWKKRTSREKKFFKSLIERRNIKSVLDCHCGTGFYLVMLSGLGCKVEGIDISPEMISVAMENLEKNKVKAKVYNMDVKDMAGSIKKKYDCVISMGNSLPHEFGDENILMALKNMYCLLKKGGTCVINIENYRLLYKDRERFIPSQYTRKDDGVDIFIFAIDYFEDKAVFNILSIIERNGHPEFYQDSIEYNPIYPEKLVSLMEKAGFKDVMLYEDYRMTPLDNEGTYDVIAIAGK